MWDDLLSSHALTALWACLAFTVLGLPVWRLHKDLKRGQARRELEAVRVATQALQNMRKDPEV